MKYLLLFLLLPYAVIAQTKVKGLGNYIIGKTTPDSIPKYEFDEDIELNAPCTLVRKFKSATQDIAGVQVMGINLSFYSNVLYKIECIYSDEVKSAFILKYGNGTPKKRGSFVFCDKRKDKPMMISGEAWSNGDITALAVHTKGLNQDCEMEDETRLVISSTSTSDLANKCDSENTEALIKGFDKALNEQKAQEKKEERDKVNKIKKEF